MMEQQVRACFTPLSGTLTLHQEMKVPGEELGQCMCSQQVGCDQVHTGLGRPDPPRPGITQST